MKDQGLKHDCLCIARNREQLIITYLIIWISPIQSFEVKEKSVSNATLNFLCLSCLLEVGFGHFPSFWKGL